MDSVVQKFNHFAQDAARVFGDFSPMTWAVITIGTVIFGYVMLKGMNLHCR